MKQYLDALQHILDHGTDKGDRTGTGTKAVFGMQLRFAMKDGFPAVTTKKLAFNSMKAELLWFIRGSSDVKELQQMGSHIWDANAEAPYWKPRARFPGDLGRIYGVQWRHWQAPDGRQIDQLADVIQLIKKEPTSRRIILTAWNPGELDQMALPPCHMFSQFFVADGRLSLQMYQRSCDMFLGVPFNIASYSLLLHMVAQVTGLEPGEFVHTLGDAHIYLTHIGQVREQLSREPYPLPKLRLNPDIKNIGDFKMDDIALEDYRFHPPIKAAMSV
jgi:thymidylate synthase